MPNVLCTICDKEFHTKPRYIKKGWGKYCSNKCQFESQKSGEYFKCSECGKKIYRTLSAIKKSKNNVFFCSKKCTCSWMNKNRKRGENSNNWISGRASYREIMKRSEKQKICTKCKIKDERILVVHHKDRNRENNHIDNLEWMCRNCHYLEHYY